MRARTVPDTVANQGTSSTGSGGVRPSAQPQQTATSRGDEQRSAATTGDWAEAADACAQQLCAAVRVLSRATGLLLSEVEKFELLQAQIGTALYWAERLEQELIGARRESNAPPINPPHWTNMGHRPLGK